MDKYLFQEMKLRLLLIVVLFMGSAHSFFFSTVNAAYDTTASFSDHSEHAHHDHGHSHSAHKNNHSDVSISSVLSVLGLYSILIAAASLWGGWLPTKIRFTHLQFQMLISAVGGILLGIGLFHLLAHALHELGPHRIDVATEWMMAGIFMMFFLLRAFHVHHHEPTPPAETEQVHTDKHAEQEHHHHVHQHHHDQTVNDYGHAGSNLTWAGMFFGLGIHTLLDGLALGAAMLADADHSTGNAYAIGVLAGIVLHKPIDSMSITTMMINAARPKSLMILVNVIYATLCPLGALVFILGISSTGLQTSLVIGCSLAFSAGVFICIALADLLPEMEFHSHHRLRLTLCLTAGIILAWAMRFLEPGHLH